MAADPILALRKQTIKSINARLARIAEQGGGEVMRQAELAEVLGLSRPRLNLLLHGKAEAFNLESLLRIALGTGLNARISLTRPYNNE